MFELRCGILFKLRRGYVQPLRPRHVSKLGGRVDLQVMSRRDLVWCDGRQGCEFLRHLRSGDIFVGRLEQLHGLCDWHV